MPRSRRAQVVALTQTTKKTQEHKAKTIQTIRDAVDKHKTIYLFSYENMRSNKFKNIRMDFRPQQPQSSADDNNMEDSNNSNNNESSRIFLGKNKLMQIALGKTIEDEYADGIHQISKRISGSVGLLLTNKEDKKVQDYFANMVEEDFARCGAVAPRRVVLTPEMIETHPVSMVEQFRKCGLPVDVSNGRVVLTGAGKTEHVVCTKGKVLSAEDCKLLFHFGIRLAEFRIKLVAKWTNGSFEELL